MENAIMHYTEQVLPDLDIISRLNNILYKKQSAFQSIMVLDLSPYGKTLVLDDKTQSAASDEHFYHEALVHPSLITCETPPKSVFIGGGGELATAREVLKHSSVERVVMVDIDYDVVQACIEHLPEWSDGAHLDPRLEIHYSDAKAFLERSEETFDVIILDIADPIEAGPGVALYFQEFYHTVYDKLNAGGCFVTQSGGCSDLLKDECFGVIHNTMKSVFPHTYAYYTDVPSFSGLWGFNMCVKKDVEERLESVTSVECVDQRVKQRIVGAEKLVLYDGIAHMGMFHLPKWLRTALAAEKRVMTKENPVYMY